MKLSVIIATHNRPGALARLLASLARQIRPERDELIIATKAGFPMWPGPYGDGGSRKYLIASCDASLKRLGVNYVDIFYHHRPDPQTPIEETVGALASLVKSGKALYVGVSVLVSGLIWFQVGGQANARTIDDVGMPIIVAIASASALVAGRRVPGRAGYGWMPLDGAGMPALQDRPSIDEAGCC